MPLQVLLDVEFGRWARKAGLSADAIRKAAEEIENGLVDARLGGFLIKKRIGAPGMGKRRAFRTIVAYREGARLIFLHGFAKNETGNITEKERAALSKLAESYMALSMNQILQMVEQALLMEV